jgi:cytochrome c oxidase cbb3-type subunit 3
MLSLAPTRVRACLLLLGLIACSEPAPTREWKPSDHGQPERVDDREQGAGEPEAASEDGVTRAARALWNASCASCHGRDGRGLGEGRPPGATIPDFTAEAFQKDRSDAQLAEVIRNGRNLMPAFGKQVNDHGVQALVQHVRAFAAGAEPAPAAP